MAPRSKVRTKKVVAETRAGFDGEPPEFGERKDFVWARGKREVVRSPCNLNTSRISWLYAHKRIERHQFLAAEQLARDWEISLIAPVASKVLFEGTSRRGGVLPGDRQVAAMQHHGAARAALGRNWAIVELVVEQNISVEKAGAALQVHPKFALGMLWSALNTLADHYRLT
ncbi:MAG: DUF6456 domain-containing protein [Rhizomicrobium sp.]